MLAIIPLSESDYRLIALFYIIRTQKTFSLPPSLFRPLSLVVIFKICISFIIHLFSFTSIYLLCVFGVGHGYPCGGQRIAVGASPPLLLPSGSVFYLGS